MKKYLLIGIVLLLLSIGLIIYHETSKINIHDLTNTGSKLEDKRVYLDTTYVAGNIMDNYYVFFGDGVQYIVNISEKEANIINNYLLDNPYDSYQIEGITKLIPKEIEENGIKFVKMWLDTNHSHYEEETDHNHDITTDDFYHYFGYVYLDTNNFYIIKIIIILTGILGLLSILYFVNNKYHFIG